MLQLTLVPMLKHPQSIVYAVHKVRDGFAALYTMLELLTAIWFRHKPISSYWVTQHEIERNTGCNQRIKCLRAEQLNVYTPGIIRDFPKTFCIPMELPA